MVSTKRDRISVDLRGLKAALVERASRSRCSPSDVVRTALARELGLDDPGAHTAQAHVARPDDADRVRVSLRLARHDAAALALAASNAGLPLGTFVVNLVAGVPLVGQGGKRADHLAALVASSAELSTLSRNVHHLTSLLRQGSVRAAQEYADMLDHIEVDVRRHLLLASNVLADMRPLRAAALSPTRSTRRT
ncbi:MAG: hypothetical protein RLY71_2628 [Pseudomonadota bacterium]|jgi:hypothetical protein